MESFNYFNYFTEIEEYFWRKRGAHLLVSPLDWAILETWQKAGIPIGAVLKGIDRAFESWARSRRAAGGRQLKSLAYCVDAVLDAAEEATEAAAGAGPEVKSSRATPEPFSRDELRKYLQRNAARLRAAAGKLRANAGASTAGAALAARFDETALKLDDALPLLDVPGALDLEDFERRMRTKRRCLRSGAKWTGRWHLTGVRCLRSSWRSWSGSIRRSGCLNILRCRG
jgi:hypothetical protein